jgi:hypothetical protein
LSVTNGPFERLHLLAVPLRDVRLHHARREEHERAVPRQHGAEIVVEERADAVLEERAGQRAQLLRRSAHAHDGDAVDRLDAARRRRGL